MTNFFEDHPILCIVLVIVMIAVIAVAVRFIPNVVFNGNRQVFDTRVGFHYVIIEVGNGELIEGPICAWNDYKNSDAVQVIMEDGTVILTHYSKVLLCSECP